MNDGLVETCYNQILDDASSSNSLVILGRGLGMARTFALFVSRHVRNTSLIIGLNISRDCAFQLIWPGIDSYSIALTRENSTLLIPRFISADYSVNDRKLLYQQGGFLVVTSNVLVHDFLHSTIPAERISGIAIFAAENIREGTNDHFALKLFRSQNRTGFVMAFSEAPSRLTGGFHSLEKLMNRMYLSRVCLWPRFHKSIKTALRQHTPDLINISVPLSPKMSALMHSLRDVVHTVCTDLSNASKLIDTSDVFCAGPKKSTRLRTNFDTIVKRQIEGLNDRISSRVRSLASDLSMLRRLLNDVLDMNCVLFYQKIATLRHTSPRSSNWLIRKEAQSALQIARSRVWVRRNTTNTKASAPTKTSKGHCVPDEADDIHDNSVHRLKAQETRRGLLVSNLESSPKWKVLKSVIAEIRGDVQCVEPNDSSLHRIIVFVNDKRLRDELLATICDGNSSFLEKQFHRIFPSVAKRIKDDSLLLGELDQRYRQSTMTQIAGSSSESTKEICRKPSPNDRSLLASSSRKQLNIALNRARNHADMVFKFENSKSSDFTVYSPKRQEVELLLWCRDWLDVQGRSCQLLSDYRPSFVVSVNPDVSLLRQTELFKATHPGLPVRLYMLTYNDYIEEEFSDSLVSREKDSFKNLIRERATMATHVNQEGRQSEDEGQFLTQTLCHTVHNSDENAGTLDSRLLKRRRVDEGKTMIIVDVRELRSRLPMLIHKAGVEIIPMTLEVGDFILSRGIAVERKTISDLYGSFASGRLFSQCEALSRHYEHPCLLIEFNSSAKLSLSLVGGGVRSELSMTCITSKVVLLIQHFPTMRILWVQGASDAVKVFQKLKEKEEQPNAQLAASYGIDSTDLSGMEFNAGPKALLRSLPGIDGSNMTNVMRQIRNVADLAELSQGELSSLLGNQDKGSDLFKFLRNAKETDMGDV